MEDGQPGKLSEVLEIEFVHDACLDPRAGARTAAYSRLAVEGLYALSRTNEPDGIHEGPRVETDAVVTHMGMRYRA